MKKIINDKPGRSPRKCVSMHRFIIDCPDGLFVHHINGDGLDSRVENLRICTHRLNIASKRIRKNNPNRPSSSKYRGVCWSKTNNKWYARVSNTGLGHFDDELDAAMAYDRAAIELYGEFANTNFPIDGKDQT